MVSILTLFITLKITQNCKICFLWTFGVADEQVSERVIQGDRLPRPEEGCPDDVWELILTCWAADPQARPTFRELASSLQDLRVSLSGAAAAAQALPDWLCHDLPQERAKPALARRHGTDTHFHRADHL